MLLASVVWLHGQDWSKRYVLGIGQTSSGPFPTRPLSAKSHHALEGVPGAGAKNGHRDLNADHELQSTTKINAASSPSRDRFRIIASIDSSLASWFA